MHLMGAEKPYLTNRKGERTTTMAELDTNNVSIETNETGEQDTEITATTAEMDALAKLRAEFAKQKAALDKATKEAGDYKKQLRQRQTAEEAAAEEKRLADEARDQELAELRKRFAVAETSKKLLGFIKDEAASNSLAEFLYGAEDAESAIDMLNKAWTTREKSLRLEYGKIPAPGVGSPDGPTITRAQLDEMSYKDRVKFAEEHPEEYNKLMGR